MTSIWTGDGSEVVNADNTYKAQRFTATEGQTAFTLTAFSYTPDTGSLLVYVSGADNFLGVHYEETDNTTVTFLTPLSAGDEVVIRGLVGSIATQTASESAAQAAQSAAEALDHLNDVIALTPANLPLPIPQGGTGQITRALALQALLSSPEERNSNILLAKADIGKTIKYTSGSFTQTFDDVASLGAGWYVILENAGNGDITLQPDGVEQIDARANYKMYSYESRLVYVNQAVTALVSLVLKSYYLTITSSATWTRPPGYASHKGEAWSGAASGQRTNNVALLSMGGGGAGYCDFELRDSILADSEVITIGAGGLAVSGVANGNLGGNTSFGSHFTVLANVGGNFYSGGSVSGITTQFAATSHSGVGYEAGTSTPGVTDGGTNATKGGAASTSFATTVLPGRSIWGGGAGGSCSSAGVETVGGVSTFGGTGGASHSVSNGEPGIVPGGGGGATQTGVSSGAGARGEVRIGGRI